MDPNVVQILELLSTQVHDDKIIARAERLESMGDTGHKAVYIDQRGWLQWIKSV